MSKKWIRRGKVPRSSQWKTYTVQGGDTLSGIASKFSTSVDVLKRANALSSDSISKGQSLKVYPYYTIVWGDTLSDIAVSFNTTCKTLQSLNPEKIKNLNLIYAEGTIRVPVGDLPAAPAPQPAPQPTPTPKPSTVTPTKTPPDRLNVPFIQDDIYPSHRGIADDYYLRIGDVQLVIPPLAIKVSSQNNVNSITALRQRESVKTKNGYSTTVIEMTLFFNGLDQLNGFPVPAPNGEEYYMDGLRALIAQFKRSPFLPVANEHLNNVHGIYNVALGGMTCQAVAGFPECMQVSLTLYKMTVTPYTNLPDWTYDEQIIYPVFRWWYQQMLIPNYVYSKVLLSPMMSWDTNLRMYVLDEEVLYPEHAEGPAKWIEVPIPEDLILIDYTVGLGNMLAPLQVSLLQDPTFQYLGGTDTKISFTFRTTNDLAITALLEIRDTLERYSRDYRNKMVTGYAAIQHEVCQFFGVNYVMIESLNVETIPNFPGVFEVRMDLISYSKTKKYNEVIDENSNELDGLEYMHGDWSDLATRETNSLISAISEIRLNKFLNNLELYPDLELPPIAAINPIIKMINDDRKKRGFTQLPYRNMEIPSYEGQTYVDPDFYITYPDITHFPADPSDLEMVYQQIALRTDSKNNQKLNPGQTAGSSTTTTTTTTSSSKPSSRYWSFDDYIYEAANKFGVAPLHIAALISIESSGRVRASSGVAYGLMQLTSDKKSMASSAGASNSDLYDPRTNILIGTMYLAGLIKQMKGYGHSNWLDLAIGAYNSGPGYNAYKEGRLPRITETQNHVKKFNTAVNTLSAYFPSTASSGTSTSTTTTTYRPGRADVPFIEGVPNPDPDALFQRMTRGFRAPKKVKKPMNQSEVDNGMPTITTHNPNDEAGLINLMEEMTFDMRYYNKRGSMNRAYPTFLLLFVDEGVWRDGKRLWNNYYAYHMVTEIDITHEKKQPVGTAVIRMVDVYGALNHDSQHRYTVPDVKRTGVVGFFDDIGGYWADKADKLFQNGIKDQYHRWMEGMFPSMTERSVAERNQLAKRINMHAGARIHLRIGYGSCASTLPVSFNGVIAEVDSDDEITVVCQSDGGELVNIIGDFAGKEGKTNAITDEGMFLGKEPQNILYELFTERTSDLAFSFTENYGRNSAYGIEHFGFLDRENYTGSGLFDQNKYDLVKNIYSSKYGYYEWSTAMSGETGGFLWLNDDEPNVVMLLTDKSVWDIGQVLADVIPDYIFYPHYHGMHSTIFYGQPHWFVKYEYALADENGDYAVNNLAELYKPFQQLHMINSGEDIIYNRTKASSVDMATVVAPVYQLDDELTRDDLIFADPDIKPEFLKVKSLNTQIVQDFPGLDTAAKILKGAAEIPAGMVAIINQLLSKIGGKTTQADKDMEKDIDPTEIFNPGRARARAAGVGLLKKELREMYKGEICILGDPAIKPHDIVVMSDLYTEMVGPFEAGRVTHSLGMKTGFITQIKPDLCVITASSSRANILRMCGVILSPMANQIRKTIGAHFIRRGVDKINNKFGIQEKLAAKVPEKWKANYGIYKTKAKDAVEKFATGLENQSSMFKRTRTLFRDMMGEAVTVEGAAVPATGGSALLALAVTLVTYSLIDKAFDWFEQNFFRTSAVRIYPLYYRNKPYYAGIDGAKTIIPGVTLDGEDNTMYRENGRNADKKLGSDVEPSKGSETKGGGNYYWPVSKTRWGITSYFGPRGSGYHHGIDLGCVSGTPIHAYYDGEVIEAHEEPSYGNLILIQHDSHPKYSEYHSVIDSYYTLYGHVRSFKVIKGQKVTAGQIIGYSGGGQSDPGHGSSTGPHLHFECRERAYKIDTAQNPLDKFLVGATEID